MRSTLLTIMVGTQAAAVVNALIQGRDLKSFLARTPQLASTIDLEGFKAVAARQMWAALAQAALLLVAPACYVWGLVTKNLLPADFVWVLIPAVVVILVARSYRPLELKAWNLPAADGELEKARDAVVTCWRTKPFPNW